MDYNSNQSQGYEPKFSGPNHSYYMGDSGSLLGLMQTGGNISPAYKRSFGLNRTAGGAKFAQALQMRSDQDRLEEIQKREAKEQKEGGFWGSVLGTAGALIGGAVGGSGGAGIGRSIGEWGGQSLAYDKQDVDMSGTVYGQQAFRDVDEAGSDYKEGILGESLLSGLETFGTAALTPGGGVYGQYNPLTKEGQFGLKSIGKGLGVSDYSGDAGLWDFASADYVQDFPELKGVDSSPYLESIWKSMDRSRRLPLPKIVKPLESADGGLIGMSNGGTTAVGILEAQGIYLTDEQRKLFEGMDTTSIGKAKTGVEQGLLSMTSGEGLSSAGGAFGAQQRGVTSAVESGQEMVTDTTEEALKTFESKTMGTAADIIAGGGEFQTALGGAPPVVDTLPLTNEGSVNYGGQTWVWSEEEGQYVSMGSMVGAEGLGGTGGLSGLSDMYLKENIDLVSKSHNGINIYTFEYKDKKHGEGVYRGVMAQEVPWASVKTDDGYLAVDYSKVDVDFERIA